jgi:hypothetical protein
LQLTQGEPGTGTASVYPDRKNPGITRAGAPPKLSFLEAIWNCFHICLSRYHQTCYVLRIGAAKPVLPVSAAIFARLA